MHRPGAPAHTVLHRRTVLRSLLTGAGVMLCSPAWRAIAQPATPAAARVPDLARFLPEGRELPASLVQESAGAREEIGQLAGTFRNSRDAAQLMASWGWVGNAYCSYAAGPGAGPSTPARLEISLHQFRTSTGAAYALSYFAHDRAVALQQQEEPSGLLLPCEATVLGEGEATRFLRNGALLVRVTVVMPWPGDRGANGAALTTATSLALAVLAQAGSDAPAMNAFC